MVRVRSVILKQFRCFSSLMVSLDAPVVCIQGDNGSGKTSFLESLYFAGCLRSFRTHVPQELVFFGQKAFFIQLEVGVQNADAPLSHQIQVGCMAAKRSVKVNNKSITAARDLLSYYRTVSMSAEDLALIADGPHVRRAFFDHILIFYQPDFVAVAKKFSTIVQQRNELLAKGMHDREYIWTSQLWQATVDIQTFRQQLIVRFQELIADIIAIYMPTLSVTFVYKSKKNMGQSFDAFLSHYQTWQHDEVRQGRSLFGAHLDDIELHFADKKSRTYASRGQQKLLVLLMKYVQAQLFIERVGKPVMLLDDFITDFDAHHGVIALDLLKKLDVQLIFSLPHAYDQWKSHISLSEALFIKFPI
ncbi:MAG TPA: DNA replication and repair protein RecF [Candidatus Bathyarchaeia archaeon]|nr:DNA replication and repair protein RecF [Candidatus Bathyarchaeia archaeon]